MLHFNRVMGSHHQHIITIACPLQPRLPECYAKRFLAGFKFRSPFCVSTENSKIRTLARPRGPRASLHINGPLVLLVCSSLWIGESALKRKIFIKITRCRYADHRTTSVPKAGLLTSFITVLATAGITRTETFGVSNLWKFMGILFVLCKQHL